MTNPDTLTVGKLVFERQPTQHHSDNCPHCKQGIHATYRADVTSESHVRSTHNVNSERAWSAHITLNRHEEIFARSQNAGERRYDELMQWRTASYHESANLALAEVHAFVHGEVEAMRCALAEREHQLRVLNDSLTAFQTEVAP